MSKCAGKVVLAEETRSTRRKMATSASSSTTNVHELTWNRTQTRVEKRPPANELPANVWQYDFLNEFLYHRRHMYQFSALLSKRVFSFDSIIH
jgi:hypothetical protein